MPTLKIFLGAAIGSSSSGRRTSGSLARRNVLDMLVATQASPLILEGQHAEMVRLA
jgi:hypothetical protein